MTTTNQPESRGKSTVKKLELGFCDWLVCTLGREMVKGVCFADDRGSKRRERE